MAEIVSSHSRRVRVGPELVNRTIESASAARAWAHRRGLRRALELELPEVGETLSLDAGWQVHRLLSTVGDVTVALVGSAAPAAVLKLARSARGTAALDRSGAVVDLLTSDVRLAGWSDLLPRRLAEGRTPQGHLVVLEQLLPGVDGRVAVRASAERVLAAVLETVRTLHERTAREATVDETLLREWVDQPVAVLQRWYSDESGERALQRLRRELYAGLRGRAVGVGWVHGDLAPGNVLVDPHTGQVSGLLDWERANDLALPDLDVVHLQLTVEMVRQRRELGALVRDLRCTPAMTDDLVPDPALVLLCWLHHVSGVVAKSQHYSRGGLWARRNINPVLSSVQPSTRRAVRVGVPRRGEDATWRR